MIIDIDGKWAVACKDRGLVICRVESQGPNVREFAVAELDENIGKLSIEVRLEGGVKGSKIEVGERIAKDVGDKHERQARRVGLAKAVAIKVRDWDRGV